MLPKFTVTRSSRSRAEGNGNSKDGSTTSTAPANINKNSQKKSLKFNIGSNANLSEATDASHTHEDSQSKGGVKPDEKSSESHRSKRAKVPATEDKEEDQEKEKTEDTSEQEQQSWTDVALDVLDKVMVKDIFAPFNEPVDAVALGIPDYYDVITHPMDFGTVWDNLDKGSYTSPYFFIRDVQRIWANCKKFNEEDSEIVRICKRAEIVFDKEWKKVAYEARRLSLLAGLERRKVGYSQWRSNKRKDATGETRGMDHEQSVAVSRKLQSKLQFRTLQEAVDDDILLVKDGIAEESVVFSPSVLALGQTLFQSGPVLGLGFMSYRK